jgi:ABC-2 family transporter protein
VIRLSWRQFRLQAGIALAALVVFAAVLAVSPRPQVIRPTIGVSSDPGSFNQRTNATATGTAASVDFHGSFLNVDRLGIVLLAIPAVIGVFWGAPLVARELETGTFRLVWTQTVTRRRWLAIKVALVGIASMTAAGVFSVLVTWWFGTTDAAVNPDRFAVFDERGMVAIGYAAFAFALGVTSGLLIRRTLPAMVATLVGFVAVRLAFITWIRPNLMAPLRTVRPLNLAVLNNVTNASTGLPKPNDWVLSNHTINAADVVIGTNGGIDPSGGVGFSRTAHDGLRIDGVGVCPGVHASNLQPTYRHPGGASHAFQSCLDKLGIRQLVTYQPGSRYWTFQAYETAIFLVLALVLVVLSVWWITRRDKAWRRSPQPAAAHPVAT